MKFLLMIIIGIVLLALVVFTIVYNNRDRKKFERQLTNDNIPNEHDEDESKNDAAAAKNTQ